MTSLQKLLAFLLIASVILAMAWIWMSHEEMMLVLSGTARLISLVLLIAANLVFVMGCYCFVEDAFSEHTFWGVCILLPLFAGILLSCGGWWLGSLQGSSILTRFPEIKQFGVTAGLIVSIGSPLVCIVLLLKRWRQFWGYALAVVSSAAYLAGWVVTMTCLGKP